MVLAEIISVAKFYSDSHAPDVQLSSCNSFFIPASGSFTAVKKFVFYIDPFTGVFLYSCWQKTQQELSNSAQKS